MGSADLRDDLNLYDVVFSDAGNGWAAGVDGTLLHTTDGGATWTPQDTGSTMVLTELALADDGLVYALEGMQPDGRSLLMTDDDGATWQRLSIGVSEVQAWGLATAGKHLWIVGDQGMILSTVHGDTTPPTGTVSGVDALWHRMPVTLTFSARDTGGSGLHTITSHIDGGPRNIGGILTVPAPSDHSGDGVHTVTWQARDWGGNAQATQTSTVKIDTRRPRTSAPYRASVVRGRFVTLKYKVVDAKPCGARATVTIRVKTLAGKTVKTLKLGKRTLNRLDSCRFRCRLRPRTYRFTVYARDAAGNVSTRSPPTGWW